MLRELGQEKAAKILATLSPAELKAIQGSWRHLWARPEQLAPGSEGASLSRADWTYWLALAGRGWGKTRCGAEWTIEQAKAPNQHIAIVAATGQDARKVMVGSDLDAIEGHSGILRISPADFMPEWSPSKMQLTWPNGTIGTLYSADRPDRLRGPQFHKAWVDEIAAWGKHGEAWDMLLFGLRLGDNPQACITTTPRPIKLLKDLVANPATVITKGTTYDNRANLSAEWFQSVITKFEGTRLGRQELNAEILDDHPGALWKLARIDELRVKSHPELQRIVVAIDPAVSANRDSSETGMIVAGVGPCHCKGKPEVHGFALRDASGKYSPAEWGQEAVSLYSHMNADRIVGEVNNGGDLVERNVRIADDSVSYRAVRASRGKYARAEPVAALYERGMVHHVGAFPKLEDQLTTWDPEAGMPSPDRLDALVWALTDLMVDRRPPPDISLPDLTGASTWGSI